MSNKLIIKEVTLAFFTNFSNYYHNGISKVLVEFEVYKTSTCVIDEKLNNAIDLETENVFHIIERNDDGRIKDSEISKIKSGEIFALQMRDKEWDEISPSHQLELKLQAKNVYNRYLEQKQPESEKKVKKIGEKKS